MLLKDLGLTQALKQSRAIFMVVLIWLNLEAKATKTAPNGSGEALRSCDRLVHRVPIALHDVQDLSHQQLRTLRGFLDPSTT